MDRARRDVARDGEVVAGAATTRARRAAAEATPSRSCARTVELVARRSARRSTSRRYREGHLTPVFFGSALNNFGVRELLDGAGRAGAPAAAAADGDAHGRARTRRRSRGFVFKIQANMDPKHRDRIAFVRLCSGRFQRGMKLHQVRTGKPMSIHNPMLFLARERELAEEAWAGDIIGIPNHGSSADRRRADRGRGAALHRHPELRAGAPAAGARWATRCGPSTSEGARGLAEEGAAQVFRPTIGADWIVGRGRASSSSTC